MSAKMKSRLFFVLSSIVLAMVSLNSAIAGEKAYIANRNAANVSVIDIDSGAVVNTIAVGFQPTSVAASEDGSRVFVLNEGNKTISVIDTTSDTVISTLDISFTFPPDSEGHGGEFDPTEIVASPSGDVVYVAAEFFGLLVVDVASGQLTELWSTLNLAQFLVSGRIDISPVGDFFYSGTFGGVIKFDAATLQPIGTFDIFPTGIVLTDGGETLFGVSIIPDFFVVDTTSFIVEEVDLGTIMRPIFFRLPDNLNFPDPVTVSPDGGTLYFLVDSITDFSIDPININVPAVAVVDIVNKVLLGVVPVGNQPSGIDITSDGRKLVVPNSSDNTVTIIDAQSLQVLSTVAVGPTPRAHRRFISGAGDKPDSDGDGVRPRPVKAMPWLNLLLLDD